MIYRICADCGQEVSFPLDQPISISCQKCGSPYVKFSQKVKITCGKCNKTITTNPNKVMITLCKECRNNIWIVNTGKSKEEVSDPIPIPEPNLLKVAIPYYYGGPNVDRAINTWLLPEVSFAIVDKGIIPPGSGICSQFKTDYFEQGGKRYPYFLQTMMDLFNLHPDCKFYGYFNSDIILPPGRPVYQLLPREGRVAVMHHRLDVSGTEKTPVRNLKPRHIIVVGKDGFIFTREVLKKIFEEFPNFVLGWPFWDTALAIYLWEKYGWDKIDFAYREIFHVSHKTSKEAIDEYQTKGGKYNHKLAKRIFKKDYSGDIWKEVCNEAFSDRDKKIERKKIGIIQPGRIGDILLVLPIAKWYYDRGYEVIWPIYKHYIELFDRVNYVHPLPLDNFNESYNGAKALLKDVDNIIDLGIGFGRPEDEWRSSGLGFDQWKYKTAGVPISEKYNLQIRRDFEKEEELKEYLHLGQFEDGYVVTHSKSSFAEHDFNIPTAIEVEQIQGFHFFDWIGVLENARYIYCVDSCVANLVNQLGICEGKRFIRTWHDIRQWVEAQRLTPVFHGWESHRPIICEEVEYPEYINDNNASSHVVNKALKYCKGDGIDLGGGDNPLPDAKNLDLKKGVDIASGIPYKNLDYIFSSHCLEHIDNYKKLLVNCYDSLKDGGILFLYLPHPEMKYWQPRNMPGHKHVMNPETVKEALLNAGFESVEFDTMPDHYYSFSMLATKGGKFGKPKRTMRTRKTIDEDITFITIAFEAMPFIKPCIKMIRQFTDNIIVVEGCIKDLFKTGNYGLYSEDGTHQFLKAQKDITYIGPRRQVEAWDNKEQMQNEALKHIDTSYIWLVDSDEFYTENQIKRVLEFIKKEKPDQINFKINNFFKSARYVMQGNHKFKNLTNDVRRVFKIKDPFNRFINHRPPELDYTPDKVISGSVMKNRKVTMCHFPYIFESQVKMKCILYELQLADDHKGIWDWYNNFFLKWKKKTHHKFEQESKYGVWYPDPGSRTKLFRGTLPKVLKPIFKNEKGVIWEK